MWARKRIDISWGDLVRAAGYVLAWQSPEPAGRGAERALAADGGVIACLTERSGFDLLLSALALPDGSEVLVSAVTIDDMARIIRGHGLVPVPVDVRWSDMAVTPEALETARTTRTRAVLLAHLYGGRMELQPLVDWAQAHGIQVWEDCAQALAGDAFRGHPAVDVVLFSLGPIKTATALGGGLLIVRDQAVLEAMRLRQSAFPRQSRLAFLRRAIKYAVIKAISTWLVFGLLVRTCRLLDRDYDRVINGAVRNVPGDDLFVRLRQQPSVPLLRLMQRRLRSLASAKTSHRSGQGQRLMELIRDHLRCPGSEAAPHLFWVFPICVPEGAAAVAQMRGAGFDATTGSALRAIRPPADRPELAPQVAQEIVEHTIFVPVYAQMPAAEVRRLAETLLRLPT